MNGLQQEPVLNGSRFNNTDACEQGRSLFSSLHGGLRNHHSGVELTSLVLTVSLFFSPLASAEKCQRAEPENTGWSIQLDNDALLGGNKDQDYTGGFAVTLSGDRATRYRWSPDRLRQWADDTIGLKVREASVSESCSQHAVSWGAALFTPAEKTSEAENPEDRPYASLFFLNSIQLAIFPERALAVKSGFTLGLLGMEFVEDMQDGIHEMLGLLSPAGWQNQISAGGELTARYALNLQKTVYQRHYANGLRQEFKWTASADAGFTTGFGAGFNWRFGRIGSPWWTFNPHQSDYVELSPDISTGNSGAGKRETYFYVGSSVNVHLYNAFLQGQFRRSPVQFDARDVVPVSAHVWGGVSVEMAPALHLEVFARVRTRELDVPDARAPAWAGLIVKRTWPQ